MFGVTLEMEQAHELVADVLYTDICSMLTTTKEEIQGMVDQIEANGVEDWNEIVDFVRELEDTFLFLGSMQSVYYSYDVEGVDLPNFEELEATLGNLIDLLMQDVTKMFNQLTVEEQIQVVDMYNQLVSKFD